MGYLVFPDSHCSLGTVFCVEPRMINGILILHAVVKSDNLHMQEFKRNTKIILCMAAVHRHPLTAILQP